MSPLIPIAGFGLIWSSSMLHRGAAISWAQAGEHGWNPDQSRSYFSRLIGGLAGVPAFLTLLVSTILLFGWWTPLLVVAGIPAAFALHMLMLGGSPERVAARMLAIRLPVSIGAILVTAWVCSQAR